MSLSASDVFSAAELETVTRCSLYDCGENGECVDLDDSATCDCGGGFYGQLCRSFTDSATCESLVLLISLIGWSGVN